MATVLTYTGEEWAAARMAAAGTLNVAATHVSFGTGTTAAAKAQTALVSQVGTRAPVSVTLNSPGNNDGSAVFSAVGTITATSAWAITEAGLFSGTALGTSAGSMFVRGDFSVINLNANDQIAFTITIDPS